MYITTNANLASITGLSSLASLGGSLLVSANPLLESLEGLENLAYIGEDVFISNNNILSDISALANVSPANVLALRITGNPLLSVCDIPFICNYLASPNGKVNIFNNSPGCNNPPEIADGCGISLSCLPYGNYSFQTQADIDGFPEDYPGCSDLQGTVHIQGNDITSLAGLNSVTSINGTFEIHSNPLLTSLSGLDSLVSVNGGLTIVGNALLNDISALSSLDTVAITFIGISNNPQLSECDIFSFCQYLAGPFGYSHCNITGNASGCQDKDQVLMECSVGIDDPAPDKESLLQISPNPSSEKITVKVPENAGPGELILFNTDGRKILIQPIVGSQAEVYIADIPSGMYFIKFRGNIKTVTGKFIKIDD
jgi:hypothetical protein